MIGYKGIWGFVDLSNIAGPKKSSRFVDIT